MNEGERAREKEQGGKNMGERARVKEQGRMSDRRWKENRRSERGRLKEYER